MIDKKNIKFSVRGKNRINHVFWFFRNSLTINFHLRNKCIRVDATDQQRLLFWISFIRSFDFFLTFALFFFTLSSSLYPFLLSRIISLNLLLFFLWLSFFHSPTLSFSAVLMSRSLSHPSYLYLSFFLFTVYRRPSLAIRGFAICGFDYPRILFYAQNLVSEGFPSIIRGFLCIWLKKWDISA